MAPPEGPLLWGLCSPIRTTGKSLRERERWAATAVVVVVVVVEGSEIAAAAAPPAVEAMASEYIASVPYERSLSIFSLWIVALCALRRAREEERQWRPQRG